MTQVSAEAGPRPTDHGGAAEAGGAHGDRAVLRTHGLRRSFGRFRAVDDLSITVREGEIYGFLGRNGAGKTTTIRMLMGIIKPNRGKIELLGTKTRRATIRQKRLIGYVSQDQHFYPWMSCQRLGSFVSGFYPNWDMGEYQRLLAALDLPPKRKFSQLSGGMRVKLALALALAHRPKLLILDEPTSSLDPVARREFLEIIDNQAKHHGRTTFFSSHRIDEVERVADTIGIINRGKLRYEGDVRTLTESIREVRYPATAMDRAAATGLVSPGGGPPALPPVGEAAPAAVQIPRPGDGVPTLPPFVPEPGFALLKETVDASGERTVILEARPARWAETAFAGASVRSLSLEDVFIAYAGAEVGGV